MNRPYFYANFRISRDFGAYHPILAENSLICTWCILVLWLKKHQLSALALGSIGASATNWSRLKKPFSSSLGLKGP